MIKALDFCCGAGGITRGLLDAGIALAAGIDQDRRLRQTYEANNAPTRFIADDITTINIHELCPRLDISTEDTGLYAAGPPALFQSENYNEPRRPQLPAPGLRPNH